MLKQFSQQLESATLLLAVMAHHTSFSNVVTVQPTARIRCAPSRCDGSPYDIRCRWQIVCKQPFAIHILYRMAELLLHIYWQIGEIYALFHRQFSFSCGTINSRENLEKVLKNIKMLTERNYNVKGNKIYRNRHLCGSR